MSAREESRAKPVKYTKTGNQAQGARQNNLGVTSQTQKEIRKIAASFLLAMTAVLWAKAATKGDSVRIVVIASASAAIFNCILSQKLGYKPAAHWLHPNNFAS